MIDIHSHILAGLDDGAPNLEESVAMVHIAAQAGTTDIVATPHANLEFAFDPKVVEGKIAELSALTAGLLRIHYGCDFHLHYENIQDAVANPAKYAINHKNYVLVELSELLAIRTADDVLERMRAAGMTPVITHPERNGVLQCNLNRLAGWVLGGCCIQITAQSLLGRFGRSAHTFSRRLLERNLVHFVASDAHDHEQRPPRLDEAHQWVSEEFGGAAAERLFTTNPAAALAGEPLSNEAIAAPPPQRSWWQIWR